MTFDGARLDLGDRTITLSPDRHTLTRAEHICPGCRATHQGYTLSFKQGGTRPVVGDRCCRSMGHLTICSHSELLATEKIRPYNHCLVPRSCQPSSHGGHTLELTCLCGATIRQNQNGPWREPKVPSWKPPKTLVRQSAPAGGEPLNS